MPERFPFSIGLNASLLQVSGSNTAQPTSPFSIGSLLSGTNHGATYTGAKIGLSEPELQDGVYISDPALKQVYIPLTVFQSFPVQMEDGSYTYITDSTSTTDNAGTNIGCLSQALNGGVCGFPDKFSKSILQAQSNSVKAFKVGGSIGYMYGDRYFQRFYPEVQWKTGKGGDFLKLKRHNCIVAEVVMPTSSTEGRPIRINLVDDGPHSAFKLDVMGAYCLLNDVKDLFKIQAEGAGGWKNIDNNIIKFPFADGKYDYVNGEISGYSPDAVLKFRENLYKNLEVSPFKRYLGTGRSGPKDGKGHSLVRVRFFIDPQNREKAEKLVKKTLPDELFKTNYQGETIDISPSFKIERNLLLADNSSIAGRILNAGVKVSTYVKNSGEGYDQAGRDLQLASNKGLTDFKYVSRHGTDCSSSVAWILAEAGLLDFGNRKVISPPGTGIWRQYKNSWPNKELPLVKGLKGVPVPIEEAKAGDIILWDRNKPSNNHVLIYAGPGQVFDFGSTKSCNKQQPLARSHLSNVSGGCWAWRIVQDA